MPILSELIINSTQEGKSENVGWRNNAQKIQNEDLESCYTTIEVPNHLVDVVRSMVEQAKSNMMDSQVSTRWESDLKLIKQLIMSNTTTYLSTTAFIDKSWDLAIARGEDKSDMIDALNYLLMGDDIDDESVTRFYNEIASHKIINAMLDDTSCWAKIRLCFSN